MGKVTGFLDFPRLAEDYVAPAERVKNYKEFVMHLSDKEAKTQGARCMDCGIPFCNNGCPVNNIIPDWNDLVYKQDWEGALEVLHSTNNFPEFTSRICPAPCESACTLNINSDPVGIKSIEHAIIDKAWENNWVLPQVPKIKTGRKIAILGRSMDKYITCARRSNQWDINDKLNLAKYSRHVNSTLRKINNDRGNYLVICTGHQAEPGSILDRSTNDKTPFIFQPGDNLIFSSRVIPVEENLKARKIMDSKLKNKGVKIQDNVHASGHGSEDDIKMLIEMVKPENVIPTHGSPAQEKPAIEIAKKLGYKEGKNVYLSQDGKVLKF